MVVKPQLLTLYKWEQTLQIIRYDFVQPYKLYEFIQIKGYQNSDFYPYTSGRAVVVKITEIIWANLCKPTNFFQKLPKHFV